MHKRMEPAGRLRWENCGGGDFWEFCYKDTGSDQFKGILQKWFTLNTFFLLEETYRLFLSALIIIMSWGCLLERSEAHLQDEVNKELVQTYGNSTWEWFCRRCERYVG